MSNDFAGVQSMNALSTRPDHVNRSASDQSIVKLFDTYLEQGIDNENARLLIRAGLGLSSKVILESLAREGRLCPTSPSQKING